MVHHILFDFDGTLYDTVEGIAKSAQYALEKLGVSAELDELRCFAGPPLADMFMERFGLEREDALQAVYDFRERYKPVGVFESRPFPEIHGLVERLHAAGKTLGIATSKREEMARLLLEREGLLPFFDAVCGSRANGDDKKWQVIARAMETLGASPEETVLIGDTKYDVAGAQRVGLPCIGVRWGYAVPGELEAAGADAIAEDCAALEALLLE